SHGVGTFLGGHGGAAENQTGQNSACEGEIFHGFGLLLAGVRRTLSAHADGNLKGVALRPGAFAHRLAKRDAVWRPRSCSGEAMRVLLVEDSADLGQAVREQIAEDGHAVDWVQRLDHATLSVKSTAYDLILLDLMLPDGGGIDFLRKRRAAGDATPVIILTAR